MLLSAGAEGGEFAQRTVVVTGGTRGIGRATVERLLRGGASVVTCGRDAAGVAALRAQLSGERLTALVLDVSRLDDVHRLADTALERYGGIFGLVNNAGTAAVGGVLEADDEQILEHVQLRILAAWRLIRRAVPVMARGGGGAIVTVAGAAGVDPTAMLAIPGVVNAALQNLSRAVADELAEQRIRSNVVNPGTLETRLGEEVLAQYAERLGLDTELLRDEMTGAMPLGRIATVEDVAEAIAFLLSDRAAMITGNTLTPDGGTLIRRARG